MGRAISESGILVEVRPPEGVEVSTRSSDGKDLIFVINHTRERKQIDLPQGADLLAGRVVGGYTELEPEEILVVKRSRD
jgi:beta-galactosidase